MLPTQAAKPSRIQNAWTKVISVPVRLAKGIWSLTQRIATFVQHYLLSWTRPNPKVVKALSLVPHVHVPLASALPEAIPGSPFVARVALTPTFLELCKTINNIVYDQLGINLDLSPQLAAIEKKNPKDIALKILSVFEDEVSSHRIAETDKAYAEQAKAMENSTDSAYLAQATQEGTKLFGLLSARKVELTPHEYRAIYLAHIRTQAYLNSLKVGPLTKELGAKFAEPKADDLMLDALKKLTARLPQLPKALGKALPAHLFKFVEPVELRAILHKGVLPALRNVLIQSLMTLLIQKRWSEINGELYGYLIETEVLEKSRLEQHLATTLSAFITSPHFNAASLPVENFKLIVSMLLDQQKKEGMLLRQALIPNALHPRFAALAVPFGQLLDPATPLETRIEANKTIQGVILDFIPVYKPLLDPTTTHNRDLFQRKRDRFNEECDRLVKVLLKDLRQRLPKDRAVASNEMLVALKAALQADPITQDRSVATATLKVAIEAGKLFLPRATWWTSWIPAFARNWGKESLNKLLTPSINSLVEPFLGSPDHLAEFVKETLDDTFLVERPDFVPESEDPDPAKAFDNDLKQIAAIAFLLAESNMSYGSSYVVGNNPEYLYSILKSTFHALVDHKLVNFARLEAFFNAFTPAPVPAPAPLPPS